jgi:acetoin utilization deacetylase AcuC-like enzyme
LLIIACGQDGNQFDPNGRNLLSTKGFRQLGRMARELADENCQGRLLMLQEGGYAVKYTIFCMYAITEGVLKVADPLEDPLVYADSIEKPQASLKAIKDVQHQWKQAISTRHFRD